MLAIYPGDMIAKLFWSQNEIPFPQTTRNNRLDLFLQQIATAQLLDSAVLTELNTNKIHWVLTVPAIWSDSSKAMMRKSAYYAGMIPTENSHRLLLGLEPECAAIACQMWGTGTTFLVADCGGGTLDITSHEVLSTSPLRLKETCPPCGGNYGSTRVDCNFWDFFSILLGPSMFRHLKEACPAQFLELTSKWETKKVMFRFDAYMSPQILINVNNVLSALNITSIAFEIMVDNWNQQHPCREACIQNSKSKVLSMSFQLMKSFFVQPITKICDKVWLCAQKSSPEFVVLAGGFARCPMLQEYMKNCFSQSHTRVIIAQDPDLSIVRGASVFGTSGGRLIVSRKSKYTFGVDATPEYDPNNAEHVKYSEHKKLHEDGKYRLQTFHVHGHAGDDIEEGRSEKMLYYPLTELQDTLDFGILVTKKKEVFLDVEEGVERICHVSVPVDMNLPFHNRGAWFQFSLGGPEIKCRVFDATGTTELKNVKLGFTIF